MFLVYVYIIVSGAGIYNYVSGVGVYMLFVRGVCMCLMFAFCIKFVRFTNIVFVVLFCQKKNWGAIFRTARYPAGLPDFSTRQSC